MEPPKRILAVGAWHLERLLRLCAGVLAAAHLLLAGGSWLGEAGGYALGAHLALLVFSVLVFYGRVPERPALVVMLVDAAAGALSSGLGVMAGGGAWSCAVGALFVAALVSGAAAFTKVEKHARW